MGAAEQRVKLIAAVLPWKCWVTVPGRQVDSRKEIGARILESSAKKLCREVELGGGEGGITDEKGQGVKLGEHEGAAEGKVIKGDSGEKLEETRLETIISSAWT